MTKFEAITSFIRKCSRATTICPQAFVRAIEKDIGVKFFVGVPDSLLKDFALYVNDNVPTDRHMIAANEGNAVCLATGYHLATGSIPLVYMQNSGLGNAINPLNSLVHRKIWNIPILLLIGWRGQPNVTDEPQHLFQGQSTLTMLDCLEIPYHVVSRDRERMQADIDKAANFLKANIPYALVVRKGTFAKFETVDDSKRQGGGLLENRGQAIRDILSWLDGPGNELLSHVIIATTGMISREIFHVRVERGQSHDRDLLCIGGMGHASSIAFGAAINGKIRRVYCFDGDGAVAMHTGALTTIGTKPHKAQFCHIVFNNGCHESVGGQPTCFQDKRVSLKSIALACGYAKAWSVEAGSPEFEQTFGTFRDDPCSPKLLEVKIDPDTDRAPIRPTITPRQNLIDFMNHIKSSIQ